MRIARSLIVGAVLAAVEAWAGDTVRIGYFPNLTHASAVLGVAGGDFRKALGGDVRVETKLFNAGPSAIEALFAGAIDLAWIGPSPAINGHLKSRGEVVVVAGAATGGASLIVRPAAGIATPEAFRGRRVGTPQLGNTQDVACRAWLRSRGLNPKAPGADVQVIPAANADQLALFQKGSLDAVWAVEPWASVLVLEGGGKVFLDERELWRSATGGKYATGVLVTTRTFIAAHRPLLAALLRAHVRLTRRIEADRARALAPLGRELTRLSGGSRPPEVLERAWRQVRLTWDPVQPSLLRYAEWAFAEGFLGRTRPDLQGLLELGPLNEALAAEGLPALK